MFLTKLFKKSYAPFTPKVVKVCGMRDAKNIYDVAQAGANWIGLIFYPQSKRYVRQISSMAGLIPDVGSFAADASFDIISYLHGRYVKLCGVFVDDMPQTIIARVVNYQLDIVQLHGDENVVMIDNLRRSIVPDIRPGIQIMKAISIASKADFRKCAQYEGHVDYFLFDTKCDTKGGSGRQFDWSLLKAYKGKTPFLLSGGIGLEDVEAIKAIHHDRCIGIDVNSKFEESPAVKDANAIKEFIAALR